MGQWYEFCGKLSMESDIIVISTGTWYRPAALSYVEYERIVFLKERKLESHLSDARIAIAEINPRAKIIWRNIPHAGRIDEYNARGMNNPKSCCRQLDIDSRDCCYPHIDGLLWSNESMNADWVLKYNKIIENVGSIFNDPVIDWFSLSIQYIREFYPDQTHYNSIHWCAGSLGVGANVLLQDAIQVLRNVEQKKKKFIFGSIEIVDSESAVLSNSVRTIDHQLVRKDVTREPQKKYPIRMLILFFALAVLIFIIAIIL
jgi:hypothetical protein